MTGPTGVRIAKASTAPRPTTRRGTKGGGSDQRPANAHAGRLSRRLPCSPRQIRLRLGQVRLILLERGGSISGGGEVRSLGEGRFSLGEVLSCAGDHPGCPGKILLPMCTCQCLMQVKPFPPGRYIKGLPLFGSTAATPAEATAASAPAAVAAVAAAAGGEACVFALDVKPVGAGGSASQAAGGSDSEPESESEGEREEGSSGASDEKNQEATAGRQVQVASGGGVFQARMVGQGYKQVCGRAEVWGDGVVPEDTALLEGAENLILDGMYHSPVGASEARPWYGSPSVLPSWQHHLLV
ncbi:unnamed protein product [Closterium sp. NIES-64]|nr:unnamed protein product [Closterium sp. NIES-64]